MAAVVVRHSDLLLMKDKATLLVRCMTADYHYLLPSTQLLGSIGFDGLRMRQKLRRCVLSHPKCVLHHPANPAIKMRMPVHLQAYLRLAERNVWTWQRRQRSWKRRRKASQEDSQG